MFNRLRTTVARTAFSARLSFSRTPRLSWLLGFPRRITPLTLVTIAFENALAIQVQADSLHRNLRDDFRYIVVDNSRTWAGRRSIAEICRLNGIEYRLLRRNPYTGRDPSFSHAEALNHSIRHLPRLAQSTVVGLLDHDAFLMESFSLFASLGVAAAYGRGQKWEGGPYLWPGLAFYRTDAFDLRNLDFRPVRGRGDTGARTCKAFTNWDEEVVLTTESTEELVAGGSTYMVERHGPWIHARSASGWRNTAHDPNGALLAVRRILLEL
ncbi:hypothetical protein ET989_12615 [Propioniciclava sinopodophylli]|uniref:Glycosyltransferase family 2 protein n=1 Tax=Propioniciclava sinopodophylli TaxID=1837344 RepID=A0A4Q9KD11_9ACTN|nr:hypothetical protein [Propioniciclava sinopodophylli]TBT83132.1 hypothetical protein ET989_12615 [Propioniciclava sinopodophylli]